MRDWPGIGKVSHALSIINGISHGPVDDCQTEFSHLVGRQPPKSLLDDRFQNAARNVGVVPRPERRGRAIRIATGREKNAKKKKRKKVSDRSADYEIEFGLIFQSALAAGEGERMVTGGGVGWWQGKVGGERRWILGAGGSGRRRTWLCFQPRPTPSENKITTISHLRIDSYPNVAINTTRNEPFTRPGNRLR